jgi:hypothetical protein
MVCHGKCYHCTECGESFVIEYEGGARPVQVSDPVIYLQRKLWEKYGGDPELLHDEGLCADCVAAEKKKQGGDVISPEVFNEIVRLAGWVERARSACSTKTMVLENVEWGNWYRKLECRGLREVAPAAYDATIGSDGFDADTAPALIARYLSEAASQLAAHGLAMAESRLDKDFRELMAKFTLNAMRLRDLLALGGRYAYFERDLRGPQNLNPFLCYEHTMRTPVASTEPHRFFDGRELNRSEVEKLVASCETPGDDGIFGAAFVDGLRQRLTASVLLAVPEPVRKGTDSAGPLFLPPRETARQRPLP